MFENQSFDTSLATFVKHHRVTTSLTLILGLVFWFVRPGYVRLPDFLLRKIVTTFLHANTLHLIVNLMNVYSLNVIEERVGSKKYLYQIVYFVVMNACVEELIDRFYVTPYSVGFSGVLFGLYTLYPVNKVFGFSCDPKYSVFILLVVTQVIMERVSFIGHLSGIISGYIYLGVRDLRIADPR